MNDSEFCVPHFYINPNVLNLAGFYPCSESLGPGKRAILWLQGCLKNCPNCTNPEMRPLIDKTWLDIGLLSNFIISIDDIEGITLVGGEPLLQYKALSVFLGLIKKAGLTVTVYTGYLYEELAELPDPDMAIMLSHIDVLVDGPYVEEENHDEMWRGSANQRILFLSDRYKGWEWVRDTKQRTICVHCDDQGHSLIIGIPSKGSSLFNK